MAGMDGVFSYAYTPAGYLEITDEDAADFLQSQFSNDLRPFEPGLCRYGLWLGAKGKVLADGHVLCEDGERFFALSEGSDGGELARWLGERIVADDVVVAAWKGYKRKSWRMGLGATRMGCGFKYRSSRNV